jgi:hypothetical protein
MAPPLLVAAGGRLLLAAFVALSLAASAANAAVSYDHRSLVINGRRRILISGSIHYPRSTPEVRSPPQPTADILASRAQMPLPCCRYRQRSALILAPFVP